MTDYILTPMQLDAMVLHEKTSVTTPFLIYEMVYKKLESYNSPQPEPFETAEIDQPDAGIYLTWTLPKALRTSISSEAENDSQLPFVPNRFLVARVQNGVSASQAITAWVLESDYINELDASAPFVDPFKLSESGVPIPTRIGRARPLAGLSSLSNSAAAFLTATGPGNSTFSAYGPGADNVFAFYDNMEGITADTAFSYYVIGWYANPADDPLQHSNWMKAEGESYYSNDVFEWVVYANNGEIPKNMLVHTLVSNVPWKPNNSSDVPNNYPQDIPNTVKVAFGNTSTDALAALNRVNGNQDADLLAAFQYDALDTFDSTASPTELEIESRQHWYGTSSGGTVWSVTPKEPDQPTALPVPDPTPLSLEQTTALNALNAVQQTCDRETRLLEQMQYTLYTLWWKWHWDTKNRVPISDEIYTTWLTEQLGYQVNGSETSSEWYIDKVKAQKTVVSSLIADVTAKQATLETLLDAETQLLQASNRPPYYYANDPVLLTSGLGRSTNFDPTGDVLCRLITQTVDSLTVNSTSYCVTPDACDQDISAQIPVLADPNQLLPTGVQQLNIENFFLSPALFAEDILGDATQADAVSTALAALPQPSVDTRFPPMDYAWPTWQQPWVPLLLDWQVTVFNEPAYTCEIGADTATFNRNYWRFDGSNYVWNGPTDETEQDFSVENARQMALRGRTFVGPYVPTTLSNQVAQLNNSLIQHGHTTDNGLHSQNLADIQAEDLLSQRLSSLAAQTVQRNFDPNVAPSGEIAEVLGDQYQGYSMPYPSNHSSFSAAVWNFAPMRGTFFVIDRLTAVDSFGRSVNLMYANYSAAPEVSDNAASYFYPIADDHLKASTSVEPYAGIPQSTSTTERMLKLEPRFTQDAQLAFNLTANNSSNDDITTSNNSPVCGWFVSNHLNRSLAVYSPEGLSLGEVYLSLQSDGTYLPTWQPNPLDDNAPARVENIDNIYVKNILTDLMNRQDSGQSVNDFIQAIDETLWHTTQTPRDDISLDVFIGRPLAVIRSSLALKLRGTAYVNQDWWNTFAVDPTNLPPAYEPAPLKEVNGGVFDDTWPVRLGSRELPSDGLVGYYLDNPTQPEETYQYFNCVQMPAQSADSDYLKEIGPDNYIDLRFTDDRVLELDASKNEIARTTLIIDPQGSCHAFTGLLPVYTQLIPDTFVTPALDSLAYLFRAGPIVSPITEASMPQPAEDQGVWRWYDPSTNSKMPLSDSYQNVVLQMPPPALKQGWLHFTPNINDSEETE